jgi:hypothetical protein
MGEFKTMITYCVCALVTTILASVFFATAHIKVTVDQTGEVALNMGRSAEVHHKVDFGYSTIRHL